MVLRISYEIFQPILLDLQEMNFFINNDFTKVYE
jgi:hypothetical protein